MKFTIWMGWVTTALCLIPVLGPVAQGGSRGGASLDNGVLRLTVTADGALTVDKRRGAELRPVLSSGRPSVSALDGGDRPEVSVVPLAEVYGPGRAIQAIYQAKGFVLRVQYGLADGMDFFTCTAWVRASDTPLRRDQIVVLDTQVDLGAGQIRSLTHDERWIAGVSVLGDKRRTSQFFAAVFNPEQSRGVVAGALTAEAESCVDLACKEGKVSLTLRTQYGGPGAGALMLAPGQTASSGPFAVFVPENIFDGLETYGRTVQRVNAIKLREPIPCGWCSWDAFGWIMHEKDIYATLDLIEKQRLVDYGFNTLQINDGWQCGWRCQRGLASQSQSLPGRDSAPRRPCRPDGSDLGAMAGAVLRRGPQVLGRSQRAIERDGSLLDEGGSACARQSSGVDDHAGRSADRKLRYFASGISPASDVTHGHIHEPMGRRLCQGRLPGLGLRRPARQVAATPRHLPQRPASDAPGHEARHVLHDLYQPRMEVARDRRRPANRQRRQRRMERHRADDSLRRGRSTSRTARSGGPTPINCT